MGVAQWRSQISLHSSGSGRRGRLRGSLQRVRGGRWLLVGHRGQSVLGGCRQVLVAHWFTAWSGAAVECFQPGTRRGADSWAGGGGADCGTGGDTEGLVQPEGVAVSPDGTNVYVASLGGATVATFARSSLGSLTSRGCIQDSHVNSQCNGNQTPGLLGADGVAISADGLSVYAAAHASNTVVQFGRGADGTLTPTRCFQTAGPDCNAMGGNAPALFGASGLAVSADGENVYVAAAIASAVVEFLRATGAPRVVTGSASSITQTAASLNATVNPQGENTAYQFEYGPTAGYGATVPIPGAGIAAAHIAQPAAIPIAGLTPSTTYHFRILALNADGSNVGADQTFTTLPPGSPRPTTPILSRLSLTPSRFRAARRGASIARAKTARTGTLVTYNDSMAATTQFTVDRTAAGVRSGTRCVQLRPKHKRPNPGKRCSLLIAHGSFKHSDHTGANSFHFTGRIAAQTLRPGTYKLVAVARSASAKSNTIITRFQLLR